MEAVSVQEMRDWVDETYPDGVGYGLAVRELLGLQDFVASQPGVSIESEEFKITWDDIYDDDVKLLLRVILEAAVSYKEPSDIEVLVKARLLEWISTPQGAGFLCTDTDARLFIADIDIVDDFMDALLYTSAHWHEASMGQYTDLAVFNHVKESCNIELFVRDLVVRVTELGRWEQDAAVKDEGRKKALEVIFIPSEGVEDVEFFFVLEKKSVNESLKNLGAEAVAKQLVTKAGIELLEIPETLKEDVFAKFKDEQWMRGHRDHIEEDKRRRLATGSSETVDRQAP